LPRRRADDILKDFMVTQKTLITNDANGFGGCGGCENASLEVAI